MNRASRSTQQEQAVAEAHQVQVILALAVTGHHDIAERLRRCQQDRQHRQPGRYPWRCRSAGCWACRRCLIIRQWQSFGLGLNDPGTSLAILPLHGDLIGAVRKLRKGLRDVRDRAARQDYRWSSVVMAGLADGDRALILIQHPGLHRAEVWATLERRYPKVVMTDPGSVGPRSRMTQENAAALALKKRGTEPLRIVVREQVCVAASSNGWDEPMPIAF